MSSAESETEGSPESDSNDGESDEEKEEEEGEDDDGCTDADEVRSLTPLYQQLTASQNFVVSAAEEARFRKSGIHDAMHRGVYVNIERACASIC